MINHCSAHGFTGSPVRSVAALPEDAGLAESRGVMFNHRGNTGTQARPDIPLLTTAFGGRAERQVVVLAIDVKST